MEDQIQIRQVCFRCKEEKLLSEFHNDKANKSGKRGVCKKCEHKRSVELQKLKYNKDTKRFKQAKYNYGLTEEEYKAKLLEQDYKCAICGREDKEGKKRLCVDHDHTTGAVRGLICQRCNSAIGYFDDNLILVRSAINYLQRWS